MTAWLRKKSSKRKFPKQASTEAVDTHSNMTCTQNVFNIKTNLELIVPEQTTKNVTRIRLKTLRKVGANKEPFTTVHLQKPYATQYFPAHSDVASGENRIKYAIQPEGFQLFLTTLSSEAFPFAEWFAF